MSQNQLKTKESLVEVIEDALLELNGLEERNCKIKNVLSEIQSDINNLNHSVASIKGKENISADQKDGQTNICEHENNAKHKILQYQLRISSDITAKLSSKIESNLHSGLLHDAFQSGISEIKKKLSSLAMIVNELSSESSPPIELVSKGVDTLSLTECNQLSDEKNENQDSSLFNLSMDQMQHQLSDALDKNMRWQNYNIEREQYVGLLLSKYNQNCIELQKMREKIGEFTSQPDKLATEQRRYFDKLLVGARQELEHQRNENLQKLTELTILKEKHKDEIGRLENSVEKWRKRYEEQRETSAALNANFENEKRRSSSNAVDSKEKQSQIQLLQHQVQLFSEDFRSERKAKELAIQEVEMLKKKISQMQKDLDKQKKPPISHKSVSTDHLKVSNEQNIKPQKRSAPLIPKRVESHKSDSLPVQFNHLRDKSNITVRRSSPAKSRTLNRSEKHRKKQFINPYEQYDSNETNELSLSHTSKLDNDSFLQCPNCGKNYAIDEHMFLLEHIDECGD